MREKEQQKPLLSKSKNESQPLLLPFFEDFSNYIGYPNEKLFMDKQAFVNRTSAVYPPSIGVITLDALNEQGEIYPHLSATSNGADTLTSRYIRLDSLFTDTLAISILPADSVYFSFYFQPGGGGLVAAGAEERIGNQPDKNDSLVLEFGRLIETPDTTYTVWDHIWSTPGFNISTWTSEDPLCYFKQILIPITDARYFNSHFQFRFRNYASLEPQPGISGWEGNVDQWHIDYIRLDVNRNYNDVFTNDLAFVAPTTSFLEKYQAMPWQQFQPADMKTRFTNYMTNLSSGTRTAEYQYFIAQNGNNVYEHPITEAIDIPPYYLKGLHTNESQANPKILYTPTLTDTTTFTITHIFRNTLGEVFCSANDTCVFEQKFHDYYAYDDGTAEYGYCLNNQFNVAFLAMKFSVRVPDFLNGVNLWFNHTNNNENEDATFSIIVWEDNNGQPGDTLYSSKVNKPSFEEQFLDFVAYKFDRKVAVSGNIWVGFKQHGNTQLNIGFDQNTDSRAFFKYNTHGVWETSVFKGTPMLRPVFGDVKESNPICCLAKTSKVSPNPTAGELRIENGELKIENVEIFDVYGKSVLSYTAHHTPHTALNISHFAPGIYIVKVLLENHTFETFKLIKN